MSSSCNSRREKADAKLFLLREGIQRGLNFSMPSRRVWSIRMSWITPGKTQDSDEDVIFTLFRTTDTAIISWFVTEYLREGAMSVTLCKNCTYFWAGTVAQKFDILRSARTPKMALRVVIFFFLISLECLQRISQSFLQLHASIRALFFCAGASLVVLFLGRQRKVVLLR